MSKLGPNYVEICEIPIYKGKGDERTQIGKIAILRGGFGHPNPKAFMDAKVSEYVKGSLHNQFIESHLDTPWVRILINCINIILFEV